MERDFIIDGAGRVVRVGDRVVIRQRTFSGNYGPGVLEKILSEDAVTVALDAGIPTMAQATWLHREDDTERRGGRPLWSWC